MDFALSDEQKLLRDTTREVLDRAYDVEKLGEVAGTERGWSPQVWSSLAEIGILGLPFAEDDGGAGAGWAEAAVVAEELGRAMAPEPVIPSAFTPGSAVSAATDADLRADVLGPVAAGESLLAYAHHEPGDRWPHSALATSAVSNDGEGFRLSGAKHLVLGGDTADRLVVTASLDGSPALFLVDTRDGDAEGMSRSTFRTHDRRRGAHLVFDATPARRLPVDDATAVITACEVVNQTLLCAEAVGAMDAALTLTTEYLKQRKQFGVPLASFQALTHRAANMYVELELARSLNAYATSRLADGRIDPATASRAKVQICESARVIGQESIQLHGGIGMTAEYPVGHAFSRLTAIAHTLGDIDDHLRVLADGVADHDMLTVI